MIKEKVIPSILVISLLSTGAVFAASGEETSKTNDFRQKFTERKIEFRDKMQERHVDKEEKRADRIEKVNEIIDKADSISSGIRADWDNMIDERMDLKNELEEIIGQKKEERQAYKDKLKDGIKSKVDNTKVQVDNGEITKEEAKQIIKAKHEEMKEKWQSKKGDIKDNRQEKREQVQERREERRDLWQDFTQAIEENDEAKVREAFDKILEKELEMNEIIKEKLQQLSLE